MTAPSTLDVLNQQTMRESVAWYVTNEDLYPPERAALASIAAEFKGKRILDLGVGTGRTTPALLDISNNYVGVDYVAEMVEQCRTRFPQVRYEHADARSMPQFADQSFDLIVFACNGISMVDHEGRLAILKEVRRLLVPGGVFIFSTYNKDSPEHERWFEFPRWVFSFNPLRLGRNTARFIVTTARSLRNRLRYIRHEVRMPEYTILNDRCHEYATMLYYITTQQQVAQLQSHGFSSSPAVYDPSGAVAALGSRADSHIFVVRG